MDGLLRIAACLGVAVVLGACGGGGSESDGGGAEQQAAQPKAEGSYVGTITGSTSRDFEMLLLENGEYWGMYGTSLGTSFQVAGFVQGSGTFQGSRFTSSNGRDFGVTPAASGTMTADFAADANSFTATGEVGGRPITVVGARPSAPAYNYNTPADLSVITGGWSLRLLTGATAILNIAPSGAFSGTSSGCAFTGTIAPRPPGKNVFDVALTFGVAPCLRPGTTGKEIALTNLVQNNTRRQLVIAGVNAARTEGAAMFGIR